MSYQHFVQKAAEWAKQRGFKKIRANCDEFESPKAFSRAATGTAVVPDATGLKRGRRSYFEIATKTGNARRKITKWKLLHRLASMRGGKLFLLAPKGHEAFVERVVSRHNLYDTQIISLRS